MTTKAPEVEKDSITLKWGTLKAWNVRTPEAFALLKKWHEMGVSMSAMAQHDTPEQKELLCQMIDASNCDEIYLDWDGEMVSKARAKEYIRTYGRGGQRIPMLAARETPPEEQ